MKKYNSSLISLNYILLFLKSLVLVLKAPD